jgi:hypothetical protein
MSLFEDASLIVTPNAQKAGKLYAIKPDSGAGDLTVTRATEATRVNSAGLIESVANNVPRLDYTNASCPSILVEPQRTNLITFSEDFTVGQASYNNASVLVNTDISPNGTLTADKVTFNGDFSAVRKNFTYLAGTTYTISFYAKRVSGVDSFIMFDSTNSVTIATFNFTNEWVRYTGTFTPAITSTLLFWVRIGGGSTSANTFLIWGAQLEAGSNATSYIPTVASAVTRNADLISKTGISSLIGQTEGTLYVNFIPIATTDVIALSGTGLFQTDVNISYDVSNRRIIAIIYTNSGYVINYTSPTGSAPINTKAKVAIGYKSGEIAVYLNGVQLLVSTNTYTMVLPMTQIKFNQSVYFGNNTVLYNEALVFKTRLSNTELQQLTTL